MIAQLDAFQIDLSDAVNVSSALCEVDRVTITAGEPAAPAGPCRAIWIWADRIEDDDALVDGCTVRSRLTISYRIDVCYEETRDDATDETHAEAADCLHDLMSLVWCGLVAGKDAGTLAGSETCERITLLPLLTDQRQGGIVSASGGIVVDYAC